MGWCGHCPCLPTAHHHHAASPFLFLSGLLPSARWAKQSTRSRGALCFASVSRCPSAALPENLGVLGRQPTIPDLERMWPRVFFFVGACVAHGETM